MAGDLYTVLSRAERLRQIGLMVLATLVLSFAGAVVIEQFVVDGGDFDGDGDLDLDKFSYESAAEPVCLSKKAKAESRHRIVAPAVEESNENRPILVLCA